MCKVTGGLIVACCIVFASACTGVSEAPGSYFDSLVNEQQELLSRSKASLVKRAMLDNRQSDSTFTPDLAGWTDELRIFKQLSVMARPAFQSTYLIEDGLRDTKSNLLIRRYSTRESIPVPRVQFFYRGNIKYIKKIEATYQQSNLLYTTTRKLTMEFDEENGKQVLSKYSVKGIQKMIFATPVEFSIESRVVL